MNTSARIVTLTLIPVAVGPLTAQPLPGKQVETKRENVRKWTVGDSQRGLVGPVTSIDEKELTMTCTDDSPPKQYTVAPVDLLAQGKRLKYADGPMAYRWADVKKGDTVCLWTAFDDGEQKRYCLAIKIYRRPGGKLPESQDPKEDSRYARDSLLNDIENGEDVSEADIAKQFPPKLDRRTGGLIDPGGLPGEYRGKLNAIRDKLDAEKAKKDKDLKATPPDKK